jgi:hypothetical protein
MAVTVSGLFFPTWRDLCKQVIALNLDAETHKVAMFTNSITPNFSTDTAYGAAPYNANEVAGTGYTAAGATLTSTTVTESPTGSLMFDAADVSWTTSTITNARCALVHADALTTPVAKPAIVLVNFGADYSTVAGTFTIQWAAAGILAIDLTP